MKIQIIEKLLFSRTYPATLTQYHIFYDLDSIEHAINRYEMLLGTDLKLSAQLDIQGEIKVVVNNNMCLWCGFPLSKYVSEYQIY